jgi:D-glycero-alpha-D-manno-heptose-7-phosphate kinase
VGGSPRETRGIPGTAGVIISRTPFRVSLVGGGSDLRQYYQVRPGSVVAMAIKRYMYVTVNKRFDSSTRVSYTKTEIVEHVRELQHEIIREALNVVGLKGGVEITTIADLPAGIGLASSSTVTVGVLNALYAFVGRHVSAEELAQRACAIEIEVLGKPIGKQDQYLAAYGGFQHVRFNPDESVEVNPIICSSEASRSLQKRLLLFYTGIQRAASSVLKDAKRRISGNGHVKAAMDQLVWLSEELRCQLLRNETAQVGQILARAWELKKHMATKVSNGVLDGYYRKAISAGAEGGKILGAGGGGCLLLHVQPRQQPSVRRAMLHAGLTEVPFAVESEGSKIIYVGG